MYLKPDSKGSNGLTALEVQNFQRRFSQTTLFDVFPFIKNALIKKLIITRYLQQRKDTWFLSSTVNVHHLEQYLAFQLK